MLRYFTLVFLVTLLCGCQHPTPSAIQPTAWLAPGTKVRLPPSSLAKPIRSQQMLTGQFKGKSQSLLVMLDANSEKLSLAGLSPLGIRLFMLNYDSTGLHTEQSIVVPHFPPASQVLADVMLSFYPISSWQQYLPKGWHLTDEGEVRQLFDPTGQAIVTIRYRAANAQRLPVSLEQHAFHYQIFINYLNE